MTPPRMRENTQSTTDGAVQPPNPPRVQPPRPYRPEEAVADANRILGGHEQGRVAREMIDVVRHLPPRDLGTFVNGLSDRQLKDWNAAANDGLRSGTMTGSERIDLANRLLRGADATGVRRLEAAMPVLSPGNATDEFLRNKIRSDDNNKQPGISFQPAHLGRDGVPDRERLFGVALYPGWNSWRDVGQGALADCHVAASLAALARANPDIIRRNIHDNLNGTYTVTLYADGRPVPVTVTGTVPALDRTGRNAYMQSDHTTWAAVYEKALAQHRADYGNLDSGGGADKIFLELTGRTNQVETRDPLRTSLGQIRALLQRGDAVVATTPRHPASAPVVGADGTTATVHGWHTYIVTRVSDGPRPTVTLVNPWARFGREDRHHEYEFTLTEAEWRRRFNSVTNVPTR